MIKNKEELEQALEDGADPMALFQPLLDLLERTREVCPECEGQGWYPNETTARTICPTCNGSGRVGDWHPERLAVLAENQELPDNPFVEHFGLMRDEGEAISSYIYPEAQQDMLKANFKRVEEL